MRPRVPGYSQGEYLNILSKLCLTMIYEIYTIRKTAVKLKNEEKSL